ncbi:MAG: phenylacetate--CoA ligase family protein [Prochlorococcus marinus CUG1435]|nr:phenylacetate--CoA ligase family protein [Prochlorococcus marinus CUG1435]
MITLTKGLILKLATNLYNKSPELIRNIGLNTYGYYLKRRKYGGNFREYCREFRERSFYSESEWNTYQTKKLRKLLLHSYKNVPYYRSSLKKAGFKEIDLKNFKLNELANIPILSKNELRKYCSSELLSEKRPSGIFIPSSGSTGTPVKIFFSRKFHQLWSAAFEVRIREWAGVSKEDARGTIGGRRVVPTYKTKPPFYKYNIFEKQLYFSAYHINENTINNYFEGISRFCPDYLTGYANSIFFLAQLFEENNFNAPKMKAIITNSEELTPKMSELFQKVFGCKTYNSYSGVEACGLFSQTSNDEFVNNQDIGILELMDNQGKIINSYKKEGEIIFTGLLNFDQPLIRYKIGDTASYSSKRCIDKRIRMPIIEKLGGRIEDVILGQDGRMMVRFHSIFLEIKGLCSAQIAQYSYTRIKVFLIVEETYIYDISENIIKSRIKSQLGENINIEFEYIDKPILSKSGKFLSVISYL